MEERRNEHGDDLISELPSGVEDADGTKLTDEEIY